MLPRTWTRTRMSLTIWNLTVLMLLCSRSHMHVNTTGCICTNLLTEGQHARHAAGQHGDLGGLGHGDVSAVRAQLNLVAIVCKAVDVLLQHVLATGSFAEYLRLQSDPQVQAVYQ